MELSFCLTSTDVETGLMPNKGKMRAEPAVDSTALTNKDDFNVNVSNILHTDGMCLC